jgi:pterin-4a-carbinolamine dehydratase
MRESARKQAYKQVQMSVLILLCRCLSASNKLAKTIKCQHKSWQVVIVNLERVALAADTLDHDSPEFSVVDDKLAFDLFKLILGYAKSAVNRRWKIG